MNSATTGNTGNARFTVICHNGSAIVSGTFVLVTETGCEIRDDGDSSTPQFALRSPVVLNILDQKQGKSVNVRAVAADVRREDGSWIYRIHWAKTPDLCSPRKKRTTKA